MKRSGQCVIGFFVMYGCLLSDVWPADDPLGQAPGQIDAQRLRNADREPVQWLTPGRDAQGTYYSPLDSINDQNVARLGFAWQYQLGTKRGLQGTR